MIDSKRIFPDNTPGPWYVHDECICCGLCENVAPHIFRLSVNYSHNVVHHQPTTPGELAEAEDARERCPMECIGNDRQPAAAALAIPAA